MTTFYTYVIRDPRTFEPIYVGKGTKARMFDHWEFMLSGHPYGAPKLYNKLTSIFRSGFLSPIYEKWIECADEKFCFWMEKFLIKSLGRENLCNLTDGGDGFTGRHTEATREKIRRSAIGKNLGRIHTAEQNKRNGDSRRGRKASLETRQKQSQSMRGKVRSAEHCRKLRESRLGKPRGPEFSQKMRDSWVIRRSKFGSSGSILSDEARQKMGAAWLGKKRCKTLAVA